MVAEKFHFYSYPPQKKNLPSDFFRYLPSRWELPILPEQRFLKKIFPEEKGNGERTVELKKIPKLTKVLVTSFDKFYHLCNIYIFGLCFVVQ